VILISVLNLCFFLFIVNLSILRRIISVLFEVVIHVTLARVSGSGGGGGVW
jgi:hypothetical protein